MKQLKTVLKLTVVFMAIGFMVTGCQKDDDAFEGHPTSKSPQGFTVRNLSLADIQKKQNIQQALGKLQKTFDVNKQKDHTERSGTDAKINASDGSFTLLTERIVEVATDSSVTYAFLLETPTDAASEFENFVLEVRHGTLISYHLLKYRLLEESTEDFPYAVNVQVISPDLVSLDDLYSQTNKMVQIGNVCVNMVCITSPRDFDCNWVIESVFDCPSGPGGGNTGGTGSGDGGTGSGSGSGGSGDGGIGTGTGGNAGTGGTGTGNTGGGGSPTPPIGVNPIGEDDKKLAELFTDCNLLADTSNSSSFQQRMQELMAQTTSNTEIGYWGIVQDGSMLYHDNWRFEGIPGEVGVSPPLPPAPIDSYIHNHFNNGGGTLPVFSGSDIQVLAYLYVNGYIDNLSEFVMVVTTPGSNINSTDDDTLYAITVSSPQKFAAFAHILAIDPLVIDSYYSFGDNPINQNISTPLNEERLARVFKDNNFGLDLYRGNVNDLDDWTRIMIKNNGTVKEDNCN